MRIDQKTDDSRRTSSRRKDWNTSEHNTGNVNKSRIHSVGTTLKLLPLTHVYAQCIEDMVLYVGRVIWWRKGNAVKRYTVYDYVHP